MTVNAQRSLRLIPKTDFSRLTGNRGELFYDPVNDTLRVFNGQTLGGGIIATRTWVNSTIAAGVINYNNLTNKPVLFSGSYNDLTNKPNLASTYQFSVAADDSTQRVISSDEVVKFTGAGGITTASNAEGAITITGTVPSSLVNGAYTVSLGSTGTLTLPTGGVIEDSFSYIKLTPAGGANEYQALLIYPTAADGNHIHLAAPGGGTTELYLGNDLHYVKLVNGGNVEVRANNGVNDAAWQFGTDGSLTLPGDIKSNGNINIEINLADSTLRRWQFGEDGQLTFPDGTNQSTAFTGSVETFISPAISANAATLNFNSGAIFALGSNSANITANFTNIPGVGGQTISTTLIITQGGTAYIPSAVTINGGGSVTPKWQGGSAPSGVINHVNIVSFTFICTATNTWTVIGSLVDYN
jgi:hypothetical protein